MSGAYGIDSFIDDMRRVIRDQVEEADVLLHLEPLVRRAIQHADWLKPSMHEADPVLGYGTTLLYAEENHGLFVVVDSWLPGRGVAPHDHGTWAVVGGLVGTEHNQFWQRKVDLTCSGQIELELVAEQDLKPGEILLMPTGTIHSVTNEADSLSLSLHVYGRHLNYTDRRQFDLQGKRELPFLINPR